MKKLILLLSLMLIATPCFGQEMARMMPGIMGGGAVPVAPPPPLTPIFFDDFETNDFSKWTSETDTQSQISVVTDTPHGGTYAMKYAYANTADAYVKKTLAQNYTESYLDFWFRVNDVTAIAVGNTYAQRVLLLRNVAASATQLIVNFRSGSSPYNFTQIRTLYYDDAGTPALDFTLNPAADTWYCYRMYRKKSTGVNATDGILRVWVDTTCGGGSPAQVTNIDDDTKDMIGQIYLGEYGANEWIVDNGTVFLFDDLYFYSGSP